MFDQLKHDQAPDFGRRAGSLRESLGSSMERATGIEPAPSVWKSDPGGCWQFLVIMEKCLQAPVCWLEGRWRAMRPRRLRDDRADHAGRWGEPGRRRDRLPDGTALGLPARSALLEPPVS